MKKLKWKMENPVAWSEERYESQSRFNSVHQEVVMHFPVTAARLFAWLNCVFIDYFCRLRGSVLIPLGIATAVLSISGAANAQSPVDGFDPNANNSVLATAVQG